MILRLFDIQRFSIQDGPGIRTSVFMKGCPLHCLWCHNPESASFEKQLLYYNEKCCGCKKCVKVCINKANFIEEGIHVFNKARCTLCGLCVEVCPNQAFEIAGYDIHLETLLQKIVRDRIFYDETGGGVTFTGGEPFFQTPGLVEIMKMCKTQRISTAIETSMNTSISNIDVVYDSVDLWLCDIKAFSSGLHLAGTGIDNTAILNNIKTLIARDANKIWIRIPLIPGFNDSEEELKNIAKFLKKHQPARIEFMAYHDLGVSKYFALYQEKSKNVFLAPSETLINKCKTILTQNGVKNLV